MKLKPAEAEAFREHLTLTEEQVADLITDMGGTLDPTETKKVLQRVIEDLVLEECTEGLSFQIDILKVTRGAFLRGFQSALLIASGETMNALTDLLEELSEPEQAEKQN